INTARTDSFTGTIPPGGSTRWGWGKVNAYAAVQSVFLVSVEETENNSGFLIYPNPGNDILKIDGVLQGDEQISIFSLDGKLVKQEKLQNSQVSISDLKNGIYLVRITSGTLNNFFRLVVNR
ncbi:MAG: T9SS type A sorting domain-containing protein, partial [Bacteroidota bacterium]